MIIYTSDLLLGFAGPSAESKEMHTTGSLVVLVSFFVFHVFFPSLDSHYMLKCSISICGGRFKCHCMSVYRESLPVPIIVPEACLVDAWLP